MANLGGGWGVEAGPQPTAAGSDVSCGSWAGYERAGGPLVTRGGHGTADLDPSSLNQQRRGEREKERAAPHSK